jgi:hypothetical protein
VPGAADAVVCRMVKVIAAIINFFIAEASMGIFCAG